MPTGFGTPLQNTPPATRRGNFASGTVAVTQDVAAQSEFPLPTQKVGVDDPIRGRAGTVLKAARYYHVPVALLWGVYGIETDFGRNVSTSSAGAQGPFQFLPSTWQSYKTSGGGSGNIQSTEDSAYAAAHYLSDLKKQTGSWDKALRSYSGGGYGLTQVLAKTRAFPYPTNLTNQAQGGILDVTPGGETVKAAANGIGDLVGNIWGTLTSGATWLRVLEFIGGLLVGYFALRQLATAAGGRS